MFLSCFTVFLDYRMHQSWSVFQTAPIPLLAKPQKHKGSREGLDAPDLPWILIFHSISASVLKALWLSHEDAFLYLFRCCIIGISCFRNSCRRLDVHLDSAAIAPATCPLPLASGAAAAWVIQKVSISEHDWRNLSTRRKSVWASIKRYLALILAPSRPDYTFPIVSLYTGRVSAPTETPPRLILNSYRITWQSHKPHIQISSPADMKYQNGRSQRLVIRISRLTSQTD